MSWLSESGQGLGAPRRIDAIYHGVLAVRSFPRALGLGPRRRCAAHVVDDEKSGACFEM